MKRQLLREQVLQPMLLWNLTTGHNCELCSYLPSPGIMGVCHPSHPSSEIQIPGCPSPFPALQPLSTEALERHWGKERLPSTPTIHHQCKFFSSLPFKLFTKSNLTHLSSQGLHLSHHLNTSPWLQPQHSLKKYICARNVSIDWGLKLCSSRLASM